MGRVVIFLAGGLLFLVGAIFLVTACILIASSKKKRQVCTAVTTATVIQVDRRTISRRGGSMPSTSWYPTFEYYAAGQRIVRESNFGSPEQDFYVGQRVALHYNPSNASEYYVQEEKVGLIAKIFIFVGIVLLVCAAGAAVVFVAVGRYW